jgi:epoxyqueuosine reductase
MSAVCGDLDGLAADLRTIGRQAGLDAVGMAPAGPFLETRAELERRREAGLHGGMHFTYSDPVRSTDPAATVPGAAAVVVGARSYLRQSPAPPAVGAGGAGLVARYSWSDHYRPLRSALSAIATRLVGDGWQAAVLVDDNALVDREAAYRAGLGWYGKNANLLLPERGSWFVLGSVVTDAPLPVATEPVADGCGPCRRCLDACPTGALVAPGVLDARRCLAWLLEAPGSFPIEFRAALGGRVYGCDDCQEVCPPNRLAARLDPPPPAQPEDEPWVDLIDLLGSTDGDILGRLARWYIPRRQARYVRRNALIALGNTGDGAAPDVESVLRRYLADPDPLLRAHAVWAAARLGRADLLAELRAGAEGGGKGDGERDPQVLAELAAAAGGVPG